MGEGGGKEEGNGERREDMKKGVEKWRGASEGERMKGLMREAWGKDDSGRGRRVISEKRVEVG